MFIVIHLSKITEKVHNLWSICKSHAVLFRCLEEYLKQRFFRILIMGSLRMQFAFCLNTTHSCVDLFMHPGG